MYNFLTTLVVFCLHVITLSSDPILYAVDIGDVDGLILLKKVSSTCPYYKSLRTNQSALLLRSSSGQWEITKGARYFTFSGNSGCSQAINGTQLFIHEGEDMSIGSWVNVQKNTVANYFSVYALEDCTTYEGAIIDADFYNGELITDSYLSEDYSLCQKKANATGRLQEPEDPLNVNIFTTLTTVKDDFVIKDGFNIPKQKTEIWCKFKSVEWLTRAVLKLDQSNKNASVTVRGNTCIGGITGLSAKIVNINEALVPTRQVDNTEANTDALEEYVKSSSNLPWLWIAIVAGAAVVILIALGFISYAIFKFFQKKRGGKGKGEGNYGKASIDSNFQYGEDKEYYNYQYDKKQTRVVDNNDMYNYEYE